jgi:4-hydroxybenzoate polyprenyltransferase
MNALASVSVKTWEKLNILSLDVIAGALAGGIMASVLLDTSPGWAYWVVLPITVWLIYTTDHLIDGYRAGKNARHKRHIFHRNKLKTLSISIGVLSLFSGYIAFAYLQPGIFRFGIFLGIAVIAYLLLILLMGKRSSIWLPKELLVAAFYTTGIWIPVIMLSEETISQVFFPAFLFFLLAFEDLILLSLMEMEGDRQQGSSSLALILGGKRTGILLNLLSVIIAIAAALIVLSAVNTSFVRAGLILLLMQLTLSLIYHNSNRLRSDDSYRYLSEAVFFLPALMLI